MLFNSYIFILLFLPLSLIGYYTLNYLKFYQASKVYLILMSFWFYGYFNHSYIFIILTSILGNYAIGHMLLTTKKRRLARGLLALDITANLGSLFFYKYYDFFLSNVNTLFKTDFNLLHIILPLGISFFTFQQLSYVIDCYKKTVPKYNFLDYSLFVTFFPQLVAGPIVLHSEIVPQFADINKKALDCSNFSKGIYALSLGLGKKVLLADTFGLIVNVGFKNIIHADVAAGCSVLNSTDLIFIMLGYTLQLYLDFSGYCDMATGIGYLFNIKLPMNFNSPYKAVSILDFWKRWHITLSRFFTTYVYIPLGGNRKGLIRTYLNILIVFIVSGLWHGANWTFVAWGLFHGLFSIATRFYFLMKKKAVAFASQLSEVQKFIHKRNEKWIQRFTSCSKHISGFAGWAITFAFVNVTFLLFRADDVFHANAGLSRLLARDYGEFNPDLLASLDVLEELIFLKNFVDETQYESIRLILFLGLFVLTLFGMFFMRNTNEKIENMKHSFREILVSASILVWCLVSFSGVATFLYFNF